MKKKLFLKEFMGKKGFIVFLIFILSGSFLITGINYVLFLASIDKGYKPDVYLNGAIVENEFENYKEIKDAYQYLQNGTKDEIEVVPCVTRLIISCSEKNGYNSVKYLVKGYSTDYISTHIEKYIVDGKVPVSGQKEVVIGNKFAQTMNLSVGDKINGQLVQIGSIGEIALFVSTDSNSDYKASDEYTVSGILSEECSFLECAAITNCEQIKNPNTIELFFKTKNAPEKYRKLMENMPDGMIGGINELYAEKREKTVSLISNEVSIAVAVLMVIYLLITLVIKGLNKKLSVMKAVGITDRYIVSSFLRGFFLITLTSVIIAISLIVVIVMFMNKEYSLFIGIHTVKFRIDWMLLVFLSGMAVFIGCNLWIILKYKIAKVSPKIDI